MKNNLIKQNIIFLFLISILLLGCDNIKITTPADSLKSIKIDGHERFIVIGSDGHDYLKNPNSYGTNYTHYIECTKCTKKDTLK